MPNRTPDGGNDDLFGFDNEDEDLEGNDPAGEGTDDESDSDDGGSATDKRLSDLQSRLDKETARANKLQKELEKGKKPGEGSSAGTNDPEREWMIQEMREASLDAVFAQYPELGQFKIDRALIDGRTRSEMRESATALVSLIKSVSSKARADAMKEFGVTAEPTGARREPAKDFSKMDDKEFERQVQIALTGGGPIW